MATITLDERIPAKCWMAPETPTPMYESGADDPAGLPDLIGGIAPTVVGYRPGRADRRVAKCLRQRLDQREVLRRPQAAPPTTITGASLRSNLAVRAPISVTLTWERRVGRRRDRLDPCVRGDSVADHAPGRIETIAG